MSKALRSGISAALITGGFIMLFAFDWRIAMAVCVIYWGSIIQNSIEDDEDNEGFPQSNY